MTGTDPSAAAILEKLKRWHKQLVEDAPHRHGELPKIDIDLLAETIALIQRLTATRPS